MYIGECAFCDNIHLSSVIFSDSAALSIIGRWAFINTNLTSVDVPSHVWFRTKGTFEDAVIITRSNRY